MIKPSKAIEFESGIAISINSYGESSEILFNILNGDNSLSLLLRIGELRNLVYEINNFLLELERIP